MIHYDMKDSEEWKESYSGISDAVSNMSGHNWQ